MAKVFVCLLVLNVAWSTHAAQLTGSATTDLNPINLATTGTADWIHWGRVNTTSVNRKAAATPQITDLAPIVGLSGRFANDQQWPSLSWSNGTPTQNSADFSGGLYFVSVGNGYEVKVPASTTQRTLKIYLGGWASTSRVLATLSDGSAAPFATTFGNANDVYQRVVTLVFSSATNGQTLTVRHTLQNTTAGGNIGVQAAALQGIGGPPPATPTFSVVDDFNDGNFAGWVPVKEADLAPQWSVVGGEFVQSNRVESFRTLVQTYHRGTFAYWSNGLRWTDYQFSVQARYLAQADSDDIGVMFRFKDAGNYYRLSLNSRYGFTRLEKKVAGVFTPLATNARGYLPNELLNIAIEVRGPQIFASINGDPLFAVTDTSLTTGSVALYSQDAAKFDNVRVEELSSAPRVFLAAPLAHSVDSTDSVRAIAHATNVPVGAYVDFVLDGRARLADSQVPFDRTFSAVGPGDHDVVAILRSQSGAELARDTNVLVGRGGEYDVAIGDSITHGAGDDVRSDNIAAGPRIVEFAGYQSLLTATLDATDTTRGKYLVFDEGVDGDPSYAAAFARVDSILARHPAVDRTLILLGTNDALHAVPSGLGCAGKACNGTVKGNLQRLIDKILWRDYPANTVRSNIVPVVALVPPAWDYANPWGSATNNLIRAYNTVIENELVGHEVGPNLFDHFMASATSNLKTLFVDTVHPNALGHAVIAVLWHNALRPSSPLPLPFVLDGLSSTGKTAPNQTLLEDGDRLYRTSAHVATTVPSQLKNGRWIVSNDADRSKTSTSYLSFKVDRPVTVYVAYDTAASALPRWMAGFRNTGLTIRTTNPAAPSLTLHAKSFPAGSIALGGNLEAPAAGARANYIPIVVES